MFKVIKYFTDKNDNGHAYNTGDTFPREGLFVSEERLAELAGPNNRRGVAVIEEVKENKENVNADMPGDKELVRPESAENKRKNTNRKRKTNAKRVPAENTK